MADDESVWGSAEERFRKLTETRGATIEQLRSGKLSPLLAESRSRVASRLHRLGVPDAERIVGADGVDQRRLTEARFAVDAISRLALERLIGTNDLTPVSFLRRGHQAARPVARIRMRSESGREKGWGTGFMVSPHLLLTNNHVLRTPGIARASTAEFSYEEDLDGRIRATTVFRLEPARFFMTDAGLDYTLVAVAPVSIGGRKLAEFRWLKLIAQTGKALEGEYVNIIQHPNGQPKQLALRENQIVAIEGDFLHYLTDTSGGSSGSPVFNDAWEVVALHHAGVPKRDDKGRIVTVDGTPWRPGLEPAWVANEGVRVSRLVDHVVKAAPSASERRAIDEMLCAAPPAPRESTFGQGPGGTTDAPRGGSPAAARTADGAVEVTVPVTLRIAVAGGQPAIAAPAVVRGPGAAAGAATTAATEPPGWREALDTLRQSRSRTYYAGEADRTDQAAYYRDIDASAGPEAMFRQLSALVRETHAVRLTYREARHEHLYPTVDLHPDGRLRSVYSGESFDPEEVLRQELALEADVQAASEALLARETAMDEQALVRELAILESQAPFNCEHVVPQSWFEHRDPMKSDLHHLFTCEWGCNSFRGNHPYHDYADYLEVTRDACGKAEDQGFEPETNKGAVARATLYFLLRYPERVERSRERLTKARLSTLLAWHKAQPPAESRWELHRNAEIYRVQKNRNPLIDRPEWAGLIDFGQGLRG